MVECRNVGLLVKNFFFKFKIFSSKFNCQKNTYIYVIKYFQGTIERLDPLSCRSVTGSPSRLCKFELFESWSRLLNVCGVNWKPMWTYMHAKKGANEYMANLELFYKKLENLKLGSWQRKDPIIDNFTLISSQ